MPQSLISEYARGTRRRLARGWSCQSKHDYGAGVSDSICNAPPCDHASARARRVTQHLVESSTQFLGKRMRSSRGINVRVVETILKLTLNRSACMDKAAHLCRLKTGVGYRRRFHEPIQNHEALIGVNSVSIWTPGGESSKSAVPPRVELLRGRLTSPC